MAMHISRKVAGRSFTAKCGCRISKGSPYIVFQDFSMWNRLYESSCISCWNKRSGIQVEEGKPE